MGRSGLCAFTLTVAVLMSPGTVTSAVHRQAASARYRPPNAE